MINYTGCYILDESGEPIPASHLEWGQWFSTHDRRVALTNLGHVRVSTVFLGLDHGWGASPPLLWETMIFGGEHDQYQDRYASKETALEGHEYAVKLASGEIEKDE
jgi:hypothetical protein